MNTGNDTIYSLHSRFSCYVVEAMKMQNELYAQKPCVVKKVYFKPGQNLALDDVIMDFDTSA